MQLTIETNTLPPAQVGVVFGPFTEGAAGGSFTGYVWSHSGSLPPGLSFSSGGVISGTPTTSGTYVFTATVTDSLGNIANSVQTIIVAAGSTLAISSSGALAAGATGVPYSLTLQASGGTNSGYNWTLYSGTLPAGLSLSSRGVISGNPTTTGTSTFQVQLTDSAGDMAVSGNLTITIGTSGGTLIINTTFLPNGVVGTAYSQTLTASGGTGSGQTWTYTGTLPAGLTLSSGGVLSGNPTTALSYTFTVTVTDSGANTGSQTFTIVIYAAGTVIMYVLSQITLTADPSSITFKVPG